jgi:predicted DNA-binding transcriptional regulator YafY
MRASRLLSLLLLLQTRGRMTAGELSERLEVSVRTVYRDVEALSAAGVPVYADRGPAGGYQLLDGYRTRLNGLTAQEASSLFLAGLPGPAAELGLGEVAAAAELKLLAALPPEPRSQARRMRERFHLDVPGWYHAEEETRFLAEAADAVWEQRPIRMTYRRWGQTVVERTVDPHGLVLKAGTWYLVARAAPPPGGMRTYRVGRILSLAPLEGYFTRLEDFDLQEYWREWSAQFRDRMYTAEALVRIAPDSVPMLRITLGAAITDAALAEASPPDDRGWIRVRLAIESPRHACWQLMRLGATVEVLDPPELRAMMTQAVAELSALYGGPA